MFICEIIVWEKRKIARSGWIAFADSKFIKNAAQWRKKSTYSFGQRWWIDDLKMNEVDKKIEKKSENVLLACFLN